MYNKYIEANNKFLNKKGIDIMTNKMTYVRALEIAIASVDGEAKEILANMEVDGE